jgi:NADPH:quinone reductase
LESIIVEQYGGPEVLTLKEVAVPEPAKGQVLVRVVAAGVNYADIMQRNGLYPGGPKPPFGAGFEAAGVIEKTGDGVSGWKAGDAVACFCESGYSEYVVADSNRLLAKPDQLNFLQAAAIPCQYLTAYHALCTLGRLSKGQAVLINAAAGGLGTMMVQIARNKGARVIGACGSDEKCAMIAALGCDHPVNYSKEDVARRVKEILEGGKCDLVIESVGGDMVARSLRCLKPRGMLVTLGAACKQPAMINAVELLANNWIVAGFHLFAYTEDTVAMMQAIQELHQWLAEDKLSILVKHALPLEDAARVHEMVENRQTTGKVVLTTGCQS